VDVSFFISIPQVAVSKESVTIVFLTTTCQEFSPETLGLTRSCR
jgi:hypothetical protein